MLAVILSVPQPSAPAASAEVLVFAASPDTFVSAAPLSFKPFYEFLEQPTSADPPEVSKRPDTLVPAALVTKVPAAQTL